ncbi:DNA-binding protein [Streptomyces sp. NPDC002092]
MAIERVSVIGGAQPVEAREVGLPDLGLRERADLQQWIIGDPSLIEPGLLILTEEYDKWATSSGDRVRDRLDLLALDSEGHLVVIELKRDGAPDDVHLQAVTYAAMVSRFTEDDLARIHAEFLRRSGRECDTQEALRLIREHCDGDELDVALLKQPRLVLVARSFPRQVTSSTVWLNEMGLDIKLVQFRLWDTGAGHVMTTSVLYPVPGLEEFTVVPARAEKAETAQRAANSTRNRKAVLRILDNGSVKPGQTLRFRAFPESLAWNNDDLDKWVAEDPRRSRATWTGDRSRPLRWEYDGDVYAPTSLVKEMVEQLTGNRPRYAFGTKYWVDDSGRDLAELADLPPEGGAASE